MNKYKIAISTLLLTLAALGFVGLALSAKLSAPPSALNIIAPADPIKPAPNSPVAFNPVKTENDIRVTLISLSRRTVFEKSTGPGIAVPYLSLLFIVEDLKKEKIKTWNSEESKIFCDGIRAKYNNTLEETFSMDHAPAGPWSLNADDPQRTVLLEQWFRQDGLPSGNSTVIIKVGVNDRTPEFHFDNVPLR